MRTNQSGLEVTVMALKLKCSLLPLLLVGSTFSGAIADCQQYPQRIQASQTLRTEGQKEFAEFGLTRDSVYAISDDGGVRYYHWLLNRPQNKLLTFRLPGYSLGDYAYSQANDTGYFGVFTDQSDTRLSVLKVPMRSLKPTRSISLIHESLDGSPLAVDERSGRIFTTCSDELREYDSKTLELKRRLRGAAGGIVTDISVSRYGEFICVRSAAREDGISQICIVNTYSWRIIYKDGISSRLYNYPLNGVSGFVNGTTYISGRTKFHISNNRVIVQAIFSELCEPVAVYKDGSSKVLCRQRSGDFAIWDCNSGQQVSKWFKLKDSGLFDDGEGSLDESVRVSHHVVAVRSKDRKRIMVYTLPQSITRQR